MTTKITIEPATVMAPPGVMAPPEAAATGAAVGGPALGHDGDDTSVAPWCWCVVMLGQTTPSVARRSASVGRALRVRELAQI